MKVGWLCDDPGYIGGAELTQAEFRRAAPEGVEVIDCPARGVVPDLDRYVVHNHMNYSAADLEAVKGKAVRYCHDVRPQQLWDAELVCCSPLQAERMGINATPIPPPVDLARFRTGAAEWNGGERSGACWFGRPHHGKGVQLAVEWAAKNEPLDFYGAGPLRPSSPHVNDCGAVPYERAPDVLSRYERFVFLPDALEPFGRSVAEAWAAGCKLTVNGNVGAVYWLTEAPDALETAAEDLWRVVTG